MEIGENEYVQSEIRIRADRNERLSYLQDRVKKSIRSRLVASIIMGAFSIIILVVTVNLRLFYQPELIISFQRMQIFGITAFYSLLTVSAAYYLLLNYLQLGSAIASKSSIDDYIKAQLPRAFEGDYLVAPESGPIELSPSAQAESARKTQLEISSERLQQEIRESSRRGSVNLFIGIATTLMGVGVLAYVVFAESDVDASDHWRYAFHFVMRISIALFIEVFAYFFLRQYKNNVEEIKYYQNEITNIELKLTALGSIDASKNQALQKIVVEALAKTERNFILRKGDSTVGLEREKLDKNEIIDLVKHAMSNGRRK